MKPGQSSAVRLTFAISLYIHASLSIFAQPLAAFPFFLVSFVSPVSFDSPGPTGETVFIDGKTASLRVLSTTDSNLERYTAMLPRERRRLMGKALGLSAKNIVSVS